MLASLHLRSARWVHSLEAPIAERAVVTMGVYVAVEKLERRARLRRLECPVTVRRQSWLPNLELPATWSSSTCTR